MQAALHARIRIVQSRTNACVKELRAALTRPSAERIGLEGLHLVQEALRSRIALQTIFLRAGEEAAMLDQLDPQLLSPSTELLSLPDDVLRSAVTTESPQPIAALAVPPAFALDDLFSTSAPLLVVLAGLQDPGNLGTILRSAEAFGASGVIALPGTVSAWNAKSLRASMGSAFRLPVIGLQLDSAVNALHANGVRSLAAVAREGAPRALGPMTRATALWIGNEGSGLSAELVALCDAGITIPCPGPVESLNAAIAASVLLYEASRQRMAF